MTIKNEVQGVVQALFGAFAGGYLPELTAEATNGSTSAMTARLVDVQGIITGMDMTSDKVFVETILHNMGVSSTNPVFEAASGWAMNELSNGGTRGDVVTAAVAFLTGIAAGAIVDSKYAAIAEAFVAKVDAGIEYSESEEGAAELVLATLRTEAEHTEPVNLTDLLTALKTTAAAAEAALVAVANEDATNDITAAPEPAANATAAQLETFVDAYTPAHATAELNAAKAAATDAVVTHEIAISDLALARATETDAVVAKALADAKAAVQANPTAKALSDTAEETAADLAADVKSNGTNVALGEQLNDAIGAYLALNADLTGDLLAAVTPLYVDLVAAIAVNTGVDAAQTAWENAVDAALDLLNHATTPEDLATGARGDALAAVFKKIDERFNLEDAAEAADTAFTVTTLGGAQNTAQTAQDARIDLIADVSDAAADIPATEAYAASLGALVKALTDANTAEAAAVTALTTTAGFNLAGAPGTLSTGGKDVIVAEQVTLTNGVATAADFAAGDVIDVSGYTYNTGDIETDGDNATLEFFIEETDDGVNVIFEREPWGSNSVVEEITIELTGLTLAELAIGPNYITLA